MSKRIAATAAGALIAMGLMPAGAPAATVTKAATQCPSTFRVLHDDMIGPAVLPQGQYVITVQAPGLTCATASSLFTQFLSDYDGELPKGWQAVPEGSGKAGFTQNGQPGFSVARSKGGKTPSTYGRVCPGSFQVLHNDTIGALSFPKGSYRIVIPKTSVIQCGQAFKLFRQFLNRPAGNLPKNWRLKPTIALFYKPANPKRKKFRVDPAT